MSGAWHVTVTEAEGAIVAQTDAYEPAEGHPDELTAWKHGLSDLIARRNVIKEQIAEARSHVVRLERKSPRA